MSTRSWEKRNIFGRYGEEAFFNEILFFFLFFFTTVLQPQTLSFPPVSFFFFYSSFSLSLSCFSPSARVRIVFATTPAKNPQGEALISKHFFLALKALVRTASRKAPIRRCSHFNFFFCSPHATHKAICFQLICKNFSIVATADLLHLSPPLNDHLVT